MKMKILPSNNRFKSQEFYNSSKSNLIIVTLFTKFSFKLLTVFFFGFFLHANSSNSGAFDVRIPTYDETGRINWELYAEEVDAMDDDIYSAKNPKMFILENQRVATTAVSKSGYFNIDQGEASGSEQLFVEGQGYEAIGNSWIFEQITPDARNRLAFSERGKIGFESGVDSGFVTGSGQFAQSKKQDNSVSTNTQDSNYDFSKDFPTTAWSEKIDIFDHGDGKRRILLQDNVFIKILDTETNSTEENFSTISCGWAEIYLGEDSNGSTDSFGKISQIHALRDVMLNQPLRKSSAMELKWKDDSGVVELLGDAKVFHQEWGEAQGEKIIIWEIDGRAEVIGGHQGRSRLLLPALNKTNNE